MKKIFAVAVLIVFFVAGCGSNNSNPTTPSSAITPTTAPTTTIIPTDPNTNATPTATLATLVSISVTPSNPTVTVRASQQFVAVGTYSDSTTQNLTASVTWSSSDNSKATISTNGLANAITTGTSTITATSENISGTATLTVTKVVTPPPQITLVSIAVTPSNPSITIDATQQFVAVGTYSDNTTQDLTASVTWSSSDTNVATVSNGLATSVAVGSVTIVATSGSVTGSATLTVTAVVIPPPSPTFTSDLSLYNVTTNGSSIFATGRDGSVAFNDDGTIHWQKNTPGLFLKSKIVNGSLHAVRALWSSSTYDVYIDKIDVSTGSTTTAIIVGSLPGGNTVCGSFATGTAIYVAATNGSSYTMTFSKFNMSLDNQIFLYTYNSGCLQDMEVSVTGGYFYTISQTSIDVFTFDGGYFGYQTAPTWASFHNTAAKGDKLYVSGYQLSLTVGGSAVRQATVWVYGIDGNLQNTFPIGEGEAEGMTFGPDGEMYVAVSGEGPVKLDPTTGTIAWTGNKSGHSVAYLNGKVYLATGSNKLKVFDFMTGECLN